MTSRGKRKKTPTSLGSFPSGAPTAALFEPLEIQVAVQRAFGVPLTSTEAMAGRLVRQRGKSAYSFIVDRYGNRIVAQTKCEGDHTHTPHNAFQAAVAVGKGADLTPPPVTSLASPHRPLASDGSLEPRRREYL